MKELPKLKLTFESLLEGEYCTVHPITGWSKYKNWSIDNYTQLIKAFPDKKFVQIGFSTDPQIPGCDHSFMGSSLLNAMRLIANAKLHIGSDSFSNHTCYMTNTPAIILWGSTQCSASGYEQHININLNLSCQPCFKEDIGISSMPRGECPNQHACMTGITVDMVAEKVKALFP